MFERNRIEGFHLQPPVPRPLLLPLCGTAIPDAGRYEDEGLLRSLLRAQLPRALRVVLGGLRLVVFARAKFPNGHAHRNKQSPFADLRHAVEAMHLGGVAIRKTIRVQTWARRANQRGHDSGKVCPGGETVGPRLQMVCGDEFHGECMILREGASIGNSYAVCQRARTISAIPVQRYLNSRDRQVFGLWRFWVVLLFPEDQWP